MPEDNIPLVMDQQDHPPGSMQGEGKKAKWAMCIGVALLFAVAMVAAYKDWM